MSPNLKQEHDTSKGSKEKTPNDWMGGKGLQAGCVLRRNRTRRKVSFQLAPCRRSTSLGPHWRRCDKRICMVCQINITQIDLLTESERLKLHDLKMLDTVAKNNGYWKMPDNVVTKFRGLENSGVENDRQENTRVWSKAKKIKLVSSVMDS